MKKPIILIALFLSLLLAACAGNSGTAEKTNGTSAAVDTGKQENGVSNPENTAESSVDKYTGIPAGYDEIMSDESVNPEDMLKYISDNIDAVSAKEAAEMLLRLETLQKNFLDQLTEKYYSDESFQTEMFEMYKNGILPDEAENIKNEKLSDLLAGARSNGFKTETAEASFFPVIDYSIYKQYAEKLPDDLREYFSLMAAESGQAPAKDGSLVIGWDEVIRRALEQEKFVTSYNQSQKAEDVSDIYKRYLSFIFKGLPNTTGFSHDSKIMDSGLKDALIKVAERKGSSGLEKAITQYVDILSRNEFKLTEEVEEFRKYIITQLVK